MKRFLLTMPVLATVFMACQQPSVIQNRILGSLEVNLSTTGANSARFTQGLQTQGTLRENDVVFTALNTAAVSTDGAYDYLQAQFTIQNTSLSTFNNLTLYAVAKNGNIGATAIKTITSFGSNTISAEQTRVAKIITPTHGLQFSSGTLSMVANREDFQAFEETNEVTALQTDFNNNVAGFSSADKALGYGFVARRCIPNCTSPTSFARDLPASSTNGIVTIALRIPKQGASTAYTFRMTFAVVNETNTRVTRGLYPPETLANAEGRQASGEVMQIGLSRAASQSSSRTNKGIDQVLVSSDPTNGNASYTALGFRRFSTGSGNHVCALTASGVAYCWGNGTQGQLGTNTTLSDQTIPVKVQDSNGQPSPLRFSSISVGSVHTCAVTIDGVAYCWGRTDTGRLGNNVTANSIQGYPIPVQDLNGNPSPLRFSSISVGNFTCGLTTDGVAYCWGSGSSGQQGNADTSNQLYPRKVLSSVGVDSSLRFSSISVGTAHTCAITTAGVAYCWGRAFNGELGDGQTPITPTPINQTTPVAVAASLGNPTTLRFSSISVGSAQTCAITTTNVAYCWGTPNNGRLGIGVTTVSQSVPVAVALSFGNPTTLRFSSISTGSLSTCALTTNNVAYCWGGSSFGRLGNNVSIVDEYPVPVPVEGTTAGTPTTLRFSSISAGGATCALTTDGLSYCWGPAGNGRLGSNTATDQLSPYRDSALSFKL